MRLPAILVLGLFVVFASGAPVEEVVVPQVPVPAAPVVPVVVAEKEAVVVPDVEVATVVVPVAEVESSAEVTTIQPEGMHN